MMNTKTPFQDSDRMIPFLESIDVLVLLDLLGTKGSKILNTNKQTEWMWRRLIDIETTLFESGLLEMTSLNNRIFIESFSYNQVGDDHVPFMNQGI